MVSANILNSTFYRFYCLGGIWLGNALLLEYKDPYHVFYIHHSIGKCQLSMEGELHM
jgi:hypothetical protein